jgi:protein ImuB
LPKKWLAVGIRTIVGGEHVGRAVLKDTHQPDGFRMEPFTVPSASAEERPHSQQRAALRQIRPAEPVAVTLRDKRPESFFFREKRDLVEPPFGLGVMNGEWWIQALSCCHQWDLVARSHDGLLLCC